MLTDHLYSTALPDFTHPTPPPDADAFLPKLLPRLEAAATETPDPECRSVCAAAAATVKRVAEEAAASRDADDRKVRVY